MNSKNAGANHDKDSDCTVDPKTDCCIVCGVGHMGGCGVCGGVAFHKSGCSEMK